MADFKIFSDLVEKFGLLLVVIFWVLFQIVSSYKTKEIISKLIRIGEKTRTHNLNVSNAVATTQQIKQTLEALIDDLECDRAYVYEYHNGGMTCAGIPFTKFSKTFECVKTGIKPYIKDMQNLPISVLGAFHVAVVSFGFLHVKDIEEIRTKGDASTYMMLSDHGVRSFYIFRIQDIAGKPIGFIGMDFCKKNIELDENQLEKFKLTAATITGLILSSQVSNTDNEEC